MADPWLQIIGLGEDGLDGLTDASRRALATAAHVFGGARHLELAGIRPDRARPWPVPFDLGPLLALRGQPVAILVSGDPFWFGAGGSVARHLDPTEWVAHGTAGVFSLLAARLGWRLEEVETLGLHAAQFALLRPVLARGVRVLATLRDGPAAGELAHWLTDQGLGATGMTVAEALGGPHERLRSVRAEAFDLKDVAAPVTVALDGTNLPQGAGLARVPGLADDSFAHDGQITKAPVRALTLSALAPRPGELLWDIGGGSGSISVEWCLAGGRALTVEKSAERVANIESNIKAFGLGARMEAIHGTAPQALKGAPLPDAVFIGGGGVDGLHGAIWDRLPPGTRLVANAVTLETEAALAALHAAHGGRLMRLELSEAVPLGRLTGWSAARPVVQWVVTKGASA